MPVFNSVLMQCGDQPYRDTSIQFKPIPMCLSSGIEVLLVSLMAFAQPSSEVGSTVS
jgi:hypothetical protein